MVGGQDFAMIILGLESADHENGIIAWQRSTYEIKTQISTTPAGNNLPQTTDDLVSPSHVNALLVSRIRGK